MKIGIDIGGSHVGIGLVDEFGNIQQKKEKYIVEKVENESQISKQNLKEEITQFIIQTIKEYQKMDFVENVGIAVPGTVNQTTIIKAVNLGIENYEITPIIEKETGTKVKLKNDAKCSALAEQKYGNFSECENGLFLCIGTGVGGAVIYNGKVLEAKEVPGFEFSHMIIQKNGLQCNCGKRGCFEIYASLKRFKEKIAYEFNLTTLRNEEVIKIEMIEKSFKVKTTKNEYISKTIIIAMGTKKKTLQIDGVKQFEGRGISYCAICDGFFYRNKDVAVIGNGDYAISEVNDLLPVVNKITILTNGKTAPDIRSEKVEINNRTIKEIFGHEKVEKIEFDDGTDINVNGIFIAQGTADSTDIAKKIGLVLENNKIKVNENMETNIKGIYACGDCIGGILQISKAVNDGMKTGLNVIKFLK